MTADEIIDLLTTMAAYDRRTVGDADVLAWQVAVGDLRYEDARDAVIRHYQASNDWIMPADVRRLVKTIRAERLNAATPPEPPAWMDPDDTQAYIDWITGTRTAIADGTYVEPDDTRELEPRDMSTLDSTFPRVDSEATRERAIQRARREKSAEQRAELPDWTPDGDSGRCPEHYRQRALAGIQDGKRQLAERFAGHEQEQT